jgi:hypothetical protein
LEVITITPVKGVVFQKPARVRQEKEEQFGKRLRTGVAFAASLVGLGAYLYLLGGLVWWLRFTAARLPADEAIGAIDGKRLLATGLKALIFELLVLGALMLIAWGAWRVARRAAGKQAAERPKARDRNPVAWGIVLIGISLGIILVSIGLQQFEFLPKTTGSSLAGSVIGGVLGAFAGAFFDEKSDLPEELLRMPAVTWSASIVLGSMAIVFLAAPAGLAVLVLIALLHLGGALNRLPSVRTAIHLIPAVLILGTCFSLVAAAYQATPPVTLPRALISTTSGGTVTGGYIGRSADGLILAKCRADTTNPMVSHRAHLKVVPKSEVAAIYLGGMRYAFDYGKNPSILDLGLYFFQRGEIGEALNTTSFDLRENKLVCGRKKSFRVTDRTRHIPTGQVREKLVVSGEGTLSLRGSDIEPIDLDVSRRSAVWLRIVPVGEAKRELERRGTTDVEVRLSFEIEGEDSEQRSHLVHLVRGSATSANRH